MGSKPAFESPQLFCLLPENTSELKFADLSWCGRSGVTMQSVSRLESALWLAFDSVVSAPEPVFMFCIADLPLLWKKLLQF